MQGPERANYILFSDVHLGADLVQHVRPHLRERLLRPSPADRDLAAMLDWYREHRDPKRPWCLVIAGDLVDFIGMSIAPKEGEPLETELTEEEELNGLGSARDHAVYKMRAVAERHPLVFEGLARFVAEGHRLVLVRGNHDMDFHWEDVRDAFVQALLDQAPGRAEDDATYAARIEFYPWFYYVKGLLYVEHGHQFDTVCNYPHLLAPMLPADPSRLHWSLSDWLLRTVVRPTPGLGSEGHEHRGPLDYLKFAWSLGLLGAVRLGHRYARALAMAARTGRAVLGSAAHAVREEHERRMTRMARRMRLRVDTVRKLARLWPRPVSSGWLGVLRNAFVDRIGAGALAVLTVPLLLLAGTPPASVLSIGVGLLVGVAGYLVWSVRQRMREVNPVESLRRGARRIAELMPARYVVMGHTHEPALERLGEATTYVNLGNWAVDDLDGPAEPAPRTHLVLRWVDGEPRAEFFRWDSERGPTPF